jgi:hypothetical protein
VSTLSAMEGGTTAFNSCRRCTCNHMMCQPHDVSAQHCKGR